MSDRLAIGLALVAALFGVVIGNGILVVDIEQGGAGGHHLIVPVPLILARPVAALVPADKSRIECPEFAEYREMAVRAVRELAAAPDAELVRVEEPGGTVVVGKTNGLFEVRVSQRAEQVLVRVPVAAVEEALASYDGKAFHLKDLVSAVRHFPHGDIVRVVSKNDRVRIAIW